jgi:hypothetical protein
MQHEVADLVRDREPAAALAAAAAQHDRVTVAARLERRLAAERRVGARHELKIERAHDMPKIHRLVDDSGGIKQAGSLTVDVCV